MSRPERAPLPDDVKARLARLEARHEHMNAIFESYMADGDEAQRRLARRLLQLRQPLDQVTHDEGDAPDWDETQARFDRSIARLQVFKQEVEQLLNQR